MPDCQLYDFCAGAFFGKVIDVFGKSVGICHPTKIGLNLKEAEQFCNRQNVIFFKAFGPQKPM